VVVTPEIALLVVPLLELLLQAPSASRPNMINTSFEYDILDLHRNHDCLNVLFGGRERYPIVQDGYKK
jgi:hypothetical protein